MQESAIYQTTEQTAVGGGVDIRLVGELSLKRSHIICDSGTRAFASVETGYAAPTDSVRGR